jgi:putative intracellular protease/amidase
LNPARQCAATAESAFSYPDTRVDQPLDEADPKDYDGLVLPGGVINPDALRMQPADGCGRQL